MTKRITATIPNSLHNAMLAVIGKQDISMSKYIEKLIRDDINTFLADIDNKASNDWEVEFAERFCPYNGEIRVNCLDKCNNPECDYMELLYFIRKLLRKGAK